MKKTVLHAALMALTVPMTVYGLGLGPMTVKSALDQPFSAEIELVDVGSLSLKEIKVNVADPENFEQIGLERAAVLSLLSFTVERNDRGKDVIKVQSTERMSDPYMELVIDLAWPQGQLYKAYTILLDPPGYHLISSTIQGSPTHYKSYKHHGAYAGEPGVIDKSTVSTVSHNPTAVSTNRKQVTYGPTITNENVWQIAQRYKSSELILPQVVLAIVGANPDAFKDGNLNGLKTGVRLIIPATAEMAQVPADLATSEVMAHDKSWNEKTPIEHVLTPPYINAQVTETKKNQEPSSYSGNASTMIPAPLPSSIPQLIPNNTTNPLSVNQPVTQNTNSQTMEQNSTTKAELSITAAAVESVREANALLMEQLRLLQKRNDKLQNDLDKRTKELETLHAQIQVLTKQRQALPSQAHSSEDGDSSSLWTYILLLLLAGGGAGFAYWYLRIRPEKNTEHKLTVSTPLITTQEEADSAKSSELMVIEPEQTPVSEPAPFTDELPAEQVVEKAYPAHKKEEDSSVQSTVQVESIKEEVSIPEEHKPDLNFEQVSVAKTEPTDIDELNIHDTEIDEASIEFIPIEAPQEQLIEPEIAAPITPDEPAVEQAKSEPAAQEEFLEFESGLHNALSSTPEQPAQEHITDAQAPQEESQGIDFVSSLSAKDSEEKGKAKKEEKAIEVDDAISQFFVENNIDEQASDERESTSDEPKDEDPDTELQAELKKDRLKSKKALETLLALAKTYISMDDLESARHSLEEVLEHGTKKQKEEASALLESIKGK